MTHEVANLAFRAINEPLHQHFRAPLADIRASLSLLGDTQTSLGSVRDIQRVIIEFTRNGEVPNSLEMNEKFSQCLYQRLSGHALRELRARPVLWSANSWATTLLYPKELSPLMDTTEWIVGCIVLVTLNVLRLFRRTCSLQCFLDRPMCPNSALDLFKGLFDESSSNRADSTKQGVSSHPVHTLEDKIVQILSNPNNFPSKGKFSPKAMAEATNVLKISYALLNHIISSHWGDIQTMPRGKKERERKDKREAKKEVEKEKKGEIGKGEEMGNCKVKKGEKGYDLLNCAEFQKLVLALDDENQKEVSSLMGVLDTLKGILEEPLEISWNAQHFEGELDVFDNAKNEFKSMWCKWFSGTLDIYNTAKDTEKVQSITLLEYVLEKADMKGMNWQFVLPGEQPVALRAKDSESFQKWHKYFTLLMSELGGNPFDSFAPPRSNVNAKWYVCGKDYYKRAAETIMSAKRCIYISDWWLSPEIYLVREGNFDFSDFQLDTMLKRMAEQGVMIYILVWKHTKVAIDLNSSGSIAYLRSLHPNIYGIAHPPSFPINWSHHQKLLIIDEAIAFVGGLDLCFGRYDDERYRLRDDNYIHTTWPGKDYYNPRICPGSPHDPFTDAFNRRMTCRMPWQDVMAEVDGAAAWDVAKNFVQRWNHHREKKLPEILLGPIIPSQTPGTATVQALRSLSKWSGGTKTERSIYRAMRAIIENAKHYIYIENQYFISSLGGGGIKNGIAKYLVDRIKLAHKRKETFRVIIVLPVHPEGSLWDSPTLYIMKWQFSTISRGGSSMLEQLSDALGPELVSQYVLFTCLRNYDFVKDQFHTEQVYVHTKLMIVDDEIVIVGR
jgi:phosphatidylserine/phosphatidylglycerophosphate/cardiolipin synthase-like enzyme